jgi:hypothetical protein
MLSLGLAKIAQTLKAGLSLYPVLCIPSDLLWDETQIQNIVRDYAGFDGYLIWVENLDEATISSGELKGLKLLVEKLAASGKPVYSLYGGYLFDLLSKYGLAGYSSGICYGESRGVDTKGGGAGNRYYIPFIHLKISEDLGNAFFAESGKNRGLMCYCDTCSAMRSTLPASMSPESYSDMFFAQMDFLDYRRHFVNVKFDEATALASMSNAQVLNALDADILTVLNIDPFKGQPPELTSGHLRTWRELFT